MKDKFGRDSSVNRRMSLRDKPRTTRGRRATCNTPIHTPNTPIQTPIQIAPRSQICDDRGFASARPLCDVSEPVRYQIQTSHPMFPQPMLSQPTRPSQPAIPSPSQPTFSQPPMPPQPRLSGEDLITPVGNRWLHTIYERVFEVVFGSWMGKYSNPFGYVAGISLASFFCLMTSGLGNAAFQRYP